MQVNRTQFMEDGYLVFREVIPPAELDALRESYELMVSRQREIWARERAPHDPPGGVWETSPQPRLLLGRDPLAGLVDEKTASAVEIWAHENMQGVSSELIGSEDAGVTEMMLMCNPVRDCGPATWHRDHHPLIRLHYRAISTILWRRDRVTFSGTSHSTTTVCYGCFPGAIYA